MNNVYTVILARLGSTRLPGKMVKEICGISVIEFLFERAKNLKNWPNIVLATSDKQKDEQDVDYKKRFKTSLIKQGNMYYLTKFERLEDISVNLKREFGKKDILRFKNNIIIKIDEVVEQLDTLYIKEKQNDQKHHEKPWKPIN